MDIQALLSPSGGDPNADTINSGVLGILGWGMSSDIFSKFYSRPLLNDFRRKNSVTGYIYKSLRASKNVGEGPRIRGPEGRALFKDQFNRHIKPNRRAEFKNLKHSQKYMKSTIHGIGWAYIISSMMDIGESVITPGISKTAARNDRTMLMDESPLDSSRAFTGRQRALQAIHDSQMTVRNVIANEASYLHQ